MEYFQRASDDNKEQSLFGRLEYIAKFWRNAINGTALYEIGSGQEPRKAFSFFEVPVGQGEYAWIDYDNDNIQQLNDLKLHDSEIKRNILKYLCLPMILQNPITCSSIIK
ncbi:MAG: hypothetical protein FJX88_01055 [Bacteroidetes bacterium]|nr:hypothetical protein [Bacteroidota bacterium]